MKVHMSQMNKIKRYIFMRKSMLFAILLSTLAVFSMVDILYSETSNDLMQKEVLAVHNKYRAELQLPPLVWSEKLATHAMKWARHLAQSGGQLRHSKGSGEGENLWKGTSGSISHTQKVDCWGSEMKYFKDGIFPNVSISGNWSDVGHYTQIIWRDTTQVGCAKATIGKYDIFVCRYSPPGNNIGQKAF
jgi:hypothetical protein